jgi:hypothetical protein
MTFNRCDFFDIKDCMEFYEIRNLKDIQEAGLTTQDNNGNILLTCGMFVLKFDKTADCGNKKCLDYPVVIRIPVLQNLCLGSMTSANQLYTVGESNLWEKAKGGKEVTDINGIKYLEFSSKCGGKFNCDKKFNSVKVKFKSGKFKQIETLNITENCPLMNLNFTAGKRKNVVYANVPCSNPDSLIIHIVVINRAGESEKISKPLSQLISKFTRSLCPITSKIVKRRILGIFPLYERSIYKKYLIN